MKIENADKVEAIDQILSIANEYGSVKSFSVYDIDMDDKCHGWTYDIAKERHLYTQERYDKTKKIILIAYNDSTKGFSCLVFDRINGVLRIDGVGEKPVVKGTEEPVEEPFTKPVEEDYESRYYFFDHGEVVKEDVHDNSFYRLKYGKWVDDANIITWFVKTKYTFREMTFDEVKKYADYY